MTRSTEPECYSAAYKRFKDLQRWMKSGTYQRAKQAAALKLKEIRKKEEVNEN